MEFLQIPSLPSLYIGFPSFSTRESWSKVTAVTRRNARGTKVGRHHSPHHARTSEQLFSLATHKNAQNAPCRRTTNHIYCHLWRPRRPLLMAQHHFLRSPQRLLPLLLQPHLLQLADCPLSWRYFKTWSTFASLPTLLENFEQNVFGATKTSLTTQRSFSLTYAAYRARESPFALLQSLKYTSRGTWIYSREKRRARTRELVSFVYICS